MAFNEAMDVKHSMAREYSMGQTNEDVDPTSWGVEEVGTWLGTIGLGQYGPAFAKHQVTGEILHMLSEELIKELGVATIGHRVHWEADQIMYEGGCTDWLCKQLMCVPCCDDPDHYKLTGAILYLTSEDRKRSKGYCSGLCQTSRATRAVDLSTIAGVRDTRAAKAAARARDARAARRSRTTTSTASATAAARADVISVELNGELGLDPVRPILVKKGQGYKVSAMITRAARPRRPRATAAPGTDAAPRRPIISDIQKIFPIFLPLLLWAWASNVYRVLRYGVTRERASGLVQMAALSDGLTHEEAVVLKEKTGTMYCFQIPMTLLNPRTSRSPPARDKAVEALGPS
ncbi:hypothetical protein JL721_4849 [Aureococcus anophagefferens]|nr:hypothetical protein JL721_4849 [Aureococcus anophagefferens]